MTETSTPLTQRRLRLTVRSRLALTYAVLLTAAGAIMLTIIYVFMGFFPSYEFAAATALPTSQLYQETSPAMPVYPTTSGPTSRLSPVEGTTTLDEGILSLTSSTSFVVSSRTDILNLLLVVSGVVLVVLAAAGAWVGWLMAGRMLRPLQYVNAAAHRAARGELAHRIDFEGPRDEISELADTFDDMLEELERSFGTYRRFAANASHELRTPLATTRAMLDVAISTSDEPNRELLLRLRETNERSIDTVEALLDLSEIEALATTLENTDLADVVAEVIDESTEEIESAGLRLDSRLRPAVVAGSPVLLRQLVTNLIQNAIRHNEPGGFIRITTGPGTTDTAQISVSNGGSVITSKAADELTAPFHRGRGRTRDASARGRGLGLSIVSAIVERHGGRLSLAPRPAGGLDVSAAFPSTTARPTIDQPLANAHS